jgi:hypothetical protein
LWCGDDVDLPLHGNTGGAGFMREFDEATTIGEI